MSRGRPIGTTDLGYCRIGGPSRSGDFHPNDEGERIMAEIASPFPAMRAFLHREIIGDDGKPIVRPELIGSRLFAEIEVAFRRTKELELTLHRDDGSLVPIESIGFQDTENLRAIGELQLEDDGLEVDEELDDELRADIEHDTAVIEEMFAGEEWRADYEPREFPRFQIHVELADESEVP